MKVSLNWLKNLVSYNLAPKELAEKLSLVSIGVKQVTDNLIELDLTYNRSDLLSLRGVAREVAAITKSSITFAQDPVGLRLATYGVDLPKTPVRLEDKNLSPVQCVAKIEGLKVETSPDEWVKKLKECGMRSVNNIADVTNLVMLEYGQPLHAFDESTVKNDTINVRLARKGEQIVTLDNKLRKLEHTDIVLADTEKSLDVAGVMGGKNTEVKQSTHTILLSASMFNPVMVRKTAQRLGLHSEASKRFQHGLTKTNLIQALSAAIKMYEDLGGKLTAISLTGDLKDKPKTVKLTQQKVNNLIGVEITRQDVETSLDKLGFKLASHMESGNVVWEVEIPYWRLDINIEEDLIEEVARMYGYEKIPAKPLEGDVPEKLDQTFPNFIYVLKVALSKAGLTEVQTYSFYSASVLKTLGFYPLDTSDMSSELVNIANPISSETKSLRNHIWPNLVEVVAKNLRRGFKDISIFEVGKVYSPKKGGLPGEKYHLAISLMNGGDNPIQELHHITQKLLPHLRGEKMRLHLGGGEDSEKLFHPTRVAGNMAEVHPRILNMFGIEKRVAILEIDL